MKLLLTNFHDGDGGGHTTYLLSLAKGLVTRHQVYVAAPCRSRLLREAAKIDGVHALAQEFPNGLRHLRAITAARRQLAACLRENAVDIVHVNGSADHRLVLSACRGLPKRPRIVLTKHNSKPMRGIGHWWRARRTDQVIAVCEYTRRALDTSAYRRCHIATVQNGVDTNHYAPWPEAAARAAREARFGASPSLILGSNAGTASYKGWMDLVEALALLSAGERAQIRVVVAGKPPSPATLRRIEAPGLRERVDFPGLLDDVRPLLAAIDVGFVLSWGVETISFACREMMAMGKPVLLSDYAGLPENVEPGIDGWLVPARDRQAIANAVSHILAQRQVLPTMGRAARTHAECQFQSAQFIARTEHVYESLLATPLGQGGVVQPSS